jgi:hypothetical protein
MSRKALLVYNNDEKASKLSYSKMEIKETP